MQLVIERRDNSAYVGGGGSLGLWVERRPAAWSRVWSCEWVPGCLELWAGRFYLVWDYARPRQAGTKGNLEGIT